MRPHNYVEEAVWELTERLSAADPGFCGCERCRSDVAARALAHVHPAYVASEMGRVVTQVQLLSDEHRAEITAQVATAIKKVKAAPRH
jgi:competence protein ComFB